MFKNTFDDYCETYESSDGAKTLYVNGLLRAKVLKDGTVEHYKDGRLHNSTGPAIERKIGENEYWLEGKQATKDQVESLIKKIEDEKKEPVKLELTKAEKEKIEKALGRKI